MLTRGTWEYMADIGQVVSIQDGDRCARVVMVDENDADGFAIGATKELLAACRLTLSYAGQLPKEVVAALRDAVDKAEKTS